MRRTHRHPVSAVPSLCSLVKAVHQVYYENDCRDDNAIGRGLTDLTARYLKQAPEDIAQTGLDCAHVTYNELIKNPVGVVKAIYKQFGWTFSPEVGILGAKTPLCNHLWACSSSNYSCRSFCSLHRSTSASWATTWPRTSASARR